MRSTVSTLPYIASSWLYHGPRLAFQPVLVWWALYASRSDRLAVAALRSGRRPCEDGGIQMAGEGDAPPTWRG